MGGGLRPHPEVAKTMAGCRGGRGGRGGTPPPHPTAVAAPQIQTLPLAEPARMKPSPQVPATSPRQTGSGGQLPLPGLCPPCSLSPLQTLHTLRDLLPSQLRG